MDFCYEISKICVKNLVKHFGQIDNPNGTHKNSN